jgi:hypothetical protein
MSLTRGQALAAKCYQCVRKHGHAARIETDRCAVTWCALHEYRPRLYPSEVLAELRAGPGVSSTSEPLRRLPCGCSAAWLDKPSAERGRTIPGVLR